MKRKIYHIDKIFGYHHKFKENKKDISSSFTLNF